MSESRDIAQHKPGGAVAHQDSTSIPIEQRVALLREAMVNPDVDPAKAVAMAELMFKMEDRDRQAEFNRDKIKAKSEMPAIYKRGLNTHQNTRHVLFEDMQRAIDPVLERNNLMLDFEGSNVGNKIMVTPILRHKNGWVEYGKPLEGPADEGKGRSAIQAVGSSVSYLKRYATELILNLVRDGEDDDGRGGQPDRLLNDRQEGMLLDAQAAHDAGNYTGWFTKLPPKDKAWLISTGRHARFGGAPALPGSESQQQPAETSPPPAANTDARPGKQTAEDWADQFVEQVAKMSCREDLDELERGAVKALDKLRTEKPDLHKTVAKALGDRKMDFRADEQEGGPSDSQRGEGATLFGED